MLARSNLYPSYGHSSLYMGTAGLINFGHIRNIRPSYAVLFDVNPHQIIYWNVVLSGVRQNQTYEGFRSFLNYSEVISKNMIAQKLGGQEFSARHSMTNVFHDGDPQSLSRQTFFYSARSFSSYMDEINFDEKDYALLRGMVMEDRIGALTLDVFDVEGWQQFSGFLKEMRADYSDFPKAVDTIYVSSVFRFVKADTDWTGRKINTLNNNGIFSILDAQKSVVIDSATVYSVSEFQTRTKDNAWPSLRQARKKESAPASGVDRSAPHFI
ncbi:MAG: hypothetical protein DI551_04785 [Micavibrio aeruginosavorus]|uniref:DUF7790 domain-containing protein n=1 Tax=Micavibrio aeruginosavorus TaxID=349221 RepID=A0A2W5N1X0_9BACT|nr:MAG: hypothetical protein DI551_04785 [Micavibrio aeruginosavorus]